jgi:hypothetical protein
MFLLLLLFDTFLGVSFDFSEINFNGLAVVAIVVAAN